MNVLTRLEKVTYSNFFNYSPVMRGDNTVANILLYHLKMLNLNLFSTTISNSLFCWFNITCIQMPLSDICLRCRWELWHTCHT